MSIYTETTKNVIAQKIEFACHLHKTIGQTFFNDQKFKALLIKLDKNIEATQKEMIASGVTMECADCAANGEGTCCGERTGHKCDSILLLINLLLGKSICIQTRDPNLCCFLTEQGCSLRARPVICVNFTCRRLSRNILHEKLVRLQQIAGEELNALFSIEEYIKKAHIVPKIGDSKVP
ncbi:MAG: hypothetical protein AB1610_08700 [Nitrospirota bacterium]